MATMLRSNIRQQLEPILDTVFGETYKNKAEVWKQCGFTIRKSKKAEERSVLMTTFGLVPKSSESAPITFDSASEGWAAILRHDEYRMAFALSRAAIDDNQYGNLAARMTTALKKSFIETRESDCANLFNRAFNSSYSGGDGKELCSTSHPLRPGGTFSNMLATAADLSEAALEDMIILIGNMTDDRGKFCNLSAKKLVIPRALQFEADRILQSEYRTGTDANDINAIVKGKYLPGGSVVNQYLSDNDAWFVLTDADDGLIFYDRIPLESGMEGDWTTEDMRYKGYERRSIGWHEPRAVAGTPGA